MCLRVRLLRASWGPRAVPRLVVATPHISRLQHLGSSHMLCSSAPRRQVWLVVWVQMVSVAVQCSLCGPQRRCSRR